MTTDGSTPSRVDGKLTPASLIKVAPASASYAEELIRQMKEAGIATPLRAAHFLGQIYVESGGFTKVVESLNYSATALLKLFSRKRISEADAYRLGRTADHKADQVGLANVLYGGEFGKRNLGNLKSGDGWKFRGRGLKQLTGFDNYLRFSKAWLGNEELIENPDRVADPDGAVASAIWFWRANKLNEIADTGSVEAVTKKVNGGTIGINDRRTWTNAFLRELS